MAEPMGESPLPVSAEKLSLRRGSACLQQHGETPSRTQACPLLGSAQRWGAPPPGPLASLPLSSWSLLGTAA